MVMMSNNFKYPKLFEKIDKAIKIVSFDFVQIYTFLRNCKFIILEDDKIRTSIDYKGCIYFSKTFLEKLTIKQLYFVLMHEAYHFLLSHFERRMDRDIKVWNMACDYYINNSLIQDKIGEPVPEQLGGVLYDPKYNGMFSEKIYKILMENINFQGGENFDTHLEEFEGMENQSNEENSFKMDDSDLDIDFLAREIIQSLKEKLQENNSSSFTEKSFGNYGIERLIKDAFYFENQEGLDWKTLLKGFIKSNKFRFTYNRINKKNYGSFIFQSLKPEEDEVNVYLYIDVSSSITYKEIQVFLNELYVISKLEKINKIFLSFFTTEIVSSFNIRTDINIEMQLKEILKDLKIGGGTCVKCIFNSTQKKPQDYLIVFSDMEFSYSNIINHKNLIFVSTTKKKPPVGKTIFFKLDINV